MREFKAGLVTLRKPTASRPSKCTVEEQTRIEALLEKNNYKLSYSALAIEVIHLGSQGSTTLKRWACKWGWQQKRS